MYVVPIGPRVRAIYWAYFFYMTSCKKQVLKDFQNWRSLKSSPFTGMANKLHDWLFFRDSQFWKYWNICSHVKLLGPFGSSHSHNFLDHGVLYECVLCEYFFAKSFFFMARILWVANASWSVSINISRFSLHTFCAPFVILTHWYFLFYSCSTHFHSAFLSRAALYFFSLSVIYLSSQPKQSFD